MNYDHIKVPKLVCESRDRALLIKRVYDSLEKDGSYTETLESNAARHILHGIPNGMDQEHLREGLGNLLKRPVNEEDFSLEGFQRLRLELSDSLVNAGHERLIDIANDLEENGAHLFYEALKEYRN